MTEEEYLEHARTHMLPKMRSSTLSLVIGGGEPDIKLCLEVGAAVLFDKPIILLVPEGRTVNEGLRRLATEIIEDCTQDATTTDRIQAAIARVLAAAVKQQMADAVKQANAAKQANA